MNISRGVPQGFLLSPTFCNLFKHFVLNQISDFNVSSMHRFQLHQDMDNIYIIGFADDTNLIDTDKGSAAVLVKMVKDLFYLVGIQTNQSKSILINIEDGILVP